MALEEEPISVLATGSHSPAPPLRRKTSIGATPSAPYIVRRKTSRQFSRDSTETLPLPTIDEDQIPADQQDNNHPHWHAFALTFVALPALAGLVFENGSSVMTDLLLLGLGCLFLYWSVKWPWQYYHSAQARIFVEEFDEDEDVAIEDETGDELEVETRETGPSIVKESPDAPKSQTQKTAAAITKQKRQDAAAKSLRQHELSALTLCFLSPVGVSYLLHAIRPYLSRPSGGLVSNSNLTLFVLAAEVRPFLHIFKLIEKQTIHLQRVVQVDSDPGAMPDTEKLESLLRRVVELESVSRSQSAEQTGNGKVPARDPVDVEKAVSSVKQSMQPQLDALNRAVRRYEKRATVQSMATDARLKDLEIRLNDAISLAAAATRMSQKPSLFSYLLDVLSGLLAELTQSIYSLISFPWRLSVWFYRLLFGPRKRKIRRKGTESDLKSKAKMEFASERGKQV